MPQLLARFKRWLLKRERRVRPSVDTSGRKSRESAAPPVAQRRIRHGLVAVVENRIQVSNPDEEGTFATLTIPDNSSMTVTIDGQPQVGRVFVQEAQQIQVHFQEIPPERKFSLRVSDDQLTVVVQTEVLTGQKYRLKNAEASRHVTLELEVQTVCPPPADPDQIIEWLAASGFQGDLDRAAVEQICYSTESTEAIVLRGSPPRPGRPAQYRLVSLPKADNPLRPRMDIPTVALGTMVAVFEPEVPGSPGRDVFGRELPPPVHKAPPVLGAGVVEVGRRVVAARDGRLVFTSKRIDVVPELVIDRHLTPEDGRVEFDGNVVVKGSVLDGSFIQATGRVDVFGSVLSATVMADGGVFVREALVASQIVAGQSKLVYHDWRANVKQCLSEFTKFEREYMQLVENVKRRKVDAQIPMLAELLISSRHPQLEKTFLGLCKKTGISEKEDARFREIKSELRTRWMGVGRTGIFPEDVKRLRRLLEDYFSELERFQSVEPAHVQAGNVTSSSVRATGKICVTGFGAYASVLESGDSIVVKGSVRGGFLMAEEGVHVRELGTPFGTETSVKVTNPEGRVVIGIRHPNTLVQVGDHRERNLTTEYEVRYKGETYASSNIARR
ncbi:MAG: FapA family protein [Alicyclobacillus sp.]|nr:FapA family protein [Alicyclobacillus sp.]